MPKIVTIYWRDIPSQVTVQEGRKRAKKLLDARYQEAIDRAAMRAKKIDTDSYLDDWRRVNKKADGDLDELLAATVAKIDTEFTDEKLDTFIRNKGLDPDQEQAEDA
ncbi:MAG: virulence factor [Cocleimonas sp.]